MSTNNYKPHLHVLPEDDANRQIANGFLLNPHLNERAIQILPIVGGWKKVLDVFKSVHARELKKYLERTERMRSVETLEALRSCSRYWLFAVPTANNLKVMERIYDKNIQRRVC